MDILISSSCPLLCSTSPQRFGQPRRWWERIALVWTGRDRGSPRRRRGRIAECLRLPWWTVENCSRDGTEDKTVEAKVEGGRERGGKRESKLRSEQRYRENRFLLSSL